MGRELEPLPHRNPYRVVKWACFAFLSTQLASLVGGSSNSVPDDISVFSRLRADRNRTEIMIKGGPVRSPLVIAEGFSPDQCRNFLTFTRQGEEDRTYEVVIATIAHEGVEEVIGLEGNETSSVFSDDCDKVAFLSSYNGKANLKIYDISERSITPVNFTGHGLSRPVWSPDGQRIAFYSLVEIDDESHRLTPKGVIYDLDTQSVIAEFPKGMFVERWNDKQITCLSCVPEFGGITQFCNEFTMDPPDV